MATLLEARAEECRPSSESFVNPGPDIAMAFSGVIPIVLADGPLAGSPGVDWRPGFGPDCPDPATHGTLPDAAAAEVVACFDGPPAGAGRFGAPRGPDADIFADPTDAPGDAAAQPVARAGRVARSVTAHPRRGRSRQLHTAVAESAATPV